MNQLAVDLSSGDKNKIIDGKKFASELLTKLAVSAGELKTKHHLIPGLAVILVGEDPASKIYVANKDKKAKELGFNSKQIFLPTAISETSLLAEIQRLNSDPKINGILVQLPLPSHIDKHKIINAIAPEKDVDGFHLSNIGKLYTGQESMIPCTPQGCLMLLKDYLKLDLSGKKAVVFGRSNIVGKPMAELLLQNNCTTSILHSHSLNLQLESSKADILIVAIGKAEFVKSDFVKEGAIVIDVGINRANDGRLVGDTDFSDLYEKVSAITPVPGGVGPMTIACLMRNSLIACLKQNSISMLL